MESLIRAFSDGEVAVGLVNYRDFCRFIDPPRDVLRAIERLRAFATKMGEKEHRKPREIFKILLEKFESMKIDSFVAKLLKVDPEIRSDELTMLFAYIDMDNDGLISFTQLEAVLNLDDVAGWCIQICCIPLSTTPLDANLNPAIIDRLTLT